MSIFRKWVLAIAMFVALIIDGICSFYLHSLLPAKSMALLHASRSGSTTRTT